MKFQLRHDSIAHKRQQKLALALLVTNLVISLFAGAIMLFYGWDPEPTRTEAILVAFFALVSWVNLLVAGGTVGWLASLLSGFTAGPPEDAPPVDAAFLAKYRMYFYYAGVFSNLVAFALVTEVTGGLAHSPFVALLVAFVLTAQQLSRFRAQSGVMLFAGVVVVVAMLLLERFASAPVESAPEQLEVAAVVLAFIAGGALSYLEKPHNHYVESRVCEPTQALVYRDGKGTWRFAFYQKHHQQDPVLLLEPNPSASGGDFPTGLEEQFMKYSAEMATAAGWENCVPEWPEKFTATTFSVRLGRRTGDPN